MDSKITKMIRDGYETAFIDVNHNSNLAYRPQFIYNDYKEGRKVFSAIESELKTCDEFIFSVAFISMGGLSHFLMLFKELKNKGVKGKILTTDYQYFNDPKALKILGAMDNI